MANIGIVTDSNSGITPQMAEDLGVMVLPMPFYIDGKCYYENVTLSREEFFEKMMADADISTSQPAPGEVMDLWNKALKIYDKIVYIPMSSALSGSYGAAMVLSGEDEYEGRVYVVDSGRVSTPMHRMVLDALELVKAGYDAEEIRDILDASRGDMTIFVGVETLKFLKKGGRISPTAAALGSILNIKPVLQFDVGTLDTYSKCRGMKAAKKTMLEAMHKQFDTAFKDAYDKNEVYLLAASSAPEDVTEQWVKDIEASFPGMPVMCDNLTLSLSCHIGYGGLGIACSCKPRVI